jgi:GH15 family glucan-1,4-alpha-glucosidase
MYRSVASLSESLAYYFEWNGYCCSRFMHYQPIENYGIIGDLNTVALAGLNGAINFMCFPAFDSPTIFAALLDMKKGGKLEIVPALSDRKTKQFYLPDTNVFLSRFLSKEGVGDITDFMPVEELYAGKELIRRVTTVKGEVRYKLLCQPRFDYARTSHTIEAISKSEILFISNGEDKTIFRLTSTVPLQIVREDVTAEVILSAIHTADFLLEYIGKQHFPWAPFGMLNIYHWQANWR